ncbi:MAG: type IV pilus twitching motility protein PilT [Elusimicrobiota bacterium]
MDLMTVFKTAIELKASDIHITPGKPPLMRLKGDIVPITTDSIFTPEQTKSFIYSILSDSQKAKFEENWELDCSFAIKGLSRFRLNVFLSKNGVEAVARIVPSKIPTPGEIGLSSEVTSLINTPKGLILVTGPTGSGKSTTLACLINLINEKYKSHIITIEDPIEFTYESKSCIIRQREVGQHTKSFSNALKSALREDPDVLLVGEMRDLETIQLTLTSAETGHLTFATLHTQDAATTVDRIIDVFPPHQQTQIRIQLASSLRAVISQILLPRKDGKGMVSAREVMIMTSAISNIIREGKTHLIYGAIETGAKFGMIPMDRSLALLVKNNIVEMDEALSKASDKEKFKKLVAGGFGV